MKIVFAIVLLLMASGAFSQSNTGVPAIDSLPKYDWDIDANRNSLGATLGFALAFPGGGQFYSKHYVRGGFLFAFEAALLYETFYNKFRQNRIFNSNIRMYRGNRDLYLGMASPYEEIIKPYSDSIASYAETMSSHIEWIDAHMDDPAYEEQVRAREMEVDALQWWINMWQTEAKPFQDTLKQLQDTAKIHDKLLSNERAKKRASKDLWTSEFAWLAGLHIYGLFDAYGIWKNNQGHSAETHYASSAIWRAALIPGWGQIYNNEYGKAGLLYMGLLGSAVSYNSRQQMVEYHLERARLAKESGDAQAVSEETEMVLFFRKKRNQYVWAMALFYIYSMADAAVDAMLHNFDSPAYFVMQPALNRGFNVEAGFYF